MEKEWIKQLKIGDKVIFDSGGWNSFGSICEVEKITKQGRPKVVGNIFNLDGRQRGGGCSLIEPTTERLRELVSSHRIRFLILALRDVDWFKLSLVKLESVNKIINDEN